MRNLTNGKTFTCAPTPTTFVEEIRMLVAAGHGAKLRAEFVALAAAHPTHGWDVTEKRLLDAGVFESA